jgi:hypothetical protein
MQHEALGKAINDMQLENIAKSVAFAAQTT